MRTEHDDYISDGANDPFATECKHEHTERLTGQATLGTFSRGRRPNSGVVDLCLECGRRFEVR